MIGKSDQDYTYEILSWLLNRGMGKKDLEAWEALKPTLHGMGLPTSHDLGMLALFYLMRTDGIFLHMAVPFVEGISTSGRVANDQLMKVHVEATNLRGALQAALDVIGHMINCGAEYDRPYVSERQSQLMRVLVSPRTAPQPWRDGE